jgi:hypothetical protein
MDSVFAEDVSEHQEPAPTLPPKAVESAPEHVPPDHAKGDDTPASPADGADPVPPA